MPKSSDNNGDEFHLPDAVVGAGNAGKRVVYKLFEQDWVQHEALRPDTPGMEGYIVDTATQEQNEDEPEVEEINNRLESYAEGEFDLRPDLMETGLTYINPLDGTTNKFVSSDGLTRKQQVKKVAESADPLINSWWLEKSKHLLSENESYKSGVNRRRALSKALFHVSELQSDPFSELFSANYSSLTLVLGLGGGTGSGLMIDLAKRLNEENIDVHLIGIIPNSKQEEKKYTANAHAALSELEYLRVSNKSPFETMTLVPFTPAESLNDKERFDEAVAQTVLAHRNLEYDDQLSKMALNGESHRYAPFTIAVPQIMRFEVGQTREIKQKIIDWIDDRNDFLAEEAEVYDDVESFITSSFSGEPPAETLKSARAMGSPGHEDFGLTVGDAQSLRDRLDQLINLLEMHEINNVGFEDAAEDWRETLNQLIKNELAELDEDEVTPRFRDQTVIFGATSSVFNLDQSPEEKYRFDSDLERFEKYIRSELENIYRRATLLSVASTVKDEALQEGIRDALTKDVTNVAGQSDLNQARKKHRNQESELREDIETLDLLTGNATGGGISEDLSSQLSDAKQAWKRKAQEPLQNLVTIDQSQEELQDLINELDEEVDRAIKRINEWTSPEEFSENPLQFDKFDRLNELLNGVGLDSISEKKVQRQIGYAASAHRIWLEAHADSKGVVEHTLTVVNDLVGGGDDEQAALQRQYETLRGDLDGAFLSISQFNQQFSASYNETYFGERKDKLRRRREEIVDSVSDALRSTLNETSVRIPETIVARWNGDDTPDFSTTGDQTHYPERLRTELSDSVHHHDYGALIEGLTVASTQGNEPVDNIVHQAVNAKFVEPAESKRKTLVTEAAAKSDQAAIYDRIIQIIQDDSTSFAEVDNPGQEPEIEYSRSYDPEYTYIRETPVEDQQTVINKDDLVEADLLKTDYRSVKKALGTEFIDNTLTSPMLPLNQKNISSENATYDEHQLMTLFMSRIFETEKKSGGELGDLMDDIEQKFRGSVNVPEGDDGYFTKRVGHGDNWDITMVSFLTGVFLDNISEVWDRQSGYCTTYQNQEEELTEDIRIRHTHGLDGRDADIAPDPGYGAFVRRTDLFNLSNPADAATIVDTNEEALNNLFLEKYDTQLFESTIDLDIDTRASESPTQGSTTED
jgi:hypothetical protein